MVLASKGRSAAAEFAICSGGQKWIADRAEPDLVAVFALALEPAAGLAQKRRQAAIHASACRSATILMLIAFPTGSMPLSRNNPGARSRMVSINSSKLSAWQQSPGTSSPSVHQ